MPPRVSSSVHGLWPGETAMRFFSWHEFDADPRSMYNPPPESIAKGCIGWSPLSGRACTMVSGAPVGATAPAGSARSEEHTSELQSLAYLVCRLLLEKKKKHIHTTRIKATP